jgi:hypothetical protein
MFDYNSFYPWAMTELPPVTSGEWVQTDEYRDEYEGFYKVTGSVYICKWPMVLKSAKGFHFAKDEQVKGLPLVSYELREALRAKEIEVDEVGGWI